MKRGILGIVGGALVLAVLWGALIVLLMGLGCEDASEADLQTVRCDSERGRGWEALRGSLLVLMVVGSVAGVAAAVSRARAWILAATAAGALACFLAAQAIGDIRLGEEPVPRLEQGRLLRDECFVSRAPRCEDGIPVKIALDREAEIGVSIGPERFEDIGSRQFRSRILGRDDTGVPGQTWEYGAGRHVLDVVGMIIGEGPLPPGRYELQVEAFVAGGGNQPDQSEGPRMLPFSVRP